MKFYRYIYYNLVILWLRKKDEPENARINAVLTISALLFLNILNIFIIIVIADKNKLIDLPDFNLPEINFDTKVWIVGVLFVVAVLNYLLLARKKQFLKIIEEFELESVEEKRRGIIRTVFLLIGSLGFPIYIFLFTTP